jgi:hypothetical protein
MNNNEIQITNVFAESIALMSNRQWESELGVHVSLLSSWEILSFRGLSFSRPPFCVTSIVCTLEKKEYL